MSLSIWQVIISGFCGVMLACIIIALIISPAFRKDLAASKGKANLFNIVSFEGALVLLLSGIFFYGMMQPLQSADEQLPALAGVDSVQSLVELNEQLQTTLASQQTLTQDQADRIALLNQQYQDYIAKETIPDFVASLSPNDKLAKALHKLPKQQIGPWSRFAESKTILVSIPARPIEQGKAVTCQNYFDGHFELFSAMPDYLLGEAVQLHANELLYRASDCQERINYDMQISCSDALQLFGDSLLTCNARGQALWVHERPQKLEVNLVPIETHAESESF